jgi:hypothetical protein
LLEIVLCAANLAVLAVAPFRAHFAVLATARHAGEHQAAALAARNMLESIDFETFTGRRGCVKHTGSLFGGRHPYGRDVCFPRRPVKT